MALYKYNTSGVFSEIKEKPFKLERDIQRMFETNMSEIMGLEMIKSEFTIKDRRIDTLAFDPQSKSFVIIEYIQYLHYHWLLRPTVWKRNKIYHRNPKL